MGQWDGLKPDAPIRGSDLSDDGSAHYETRAQLGQFTLISLDPRRSRQARTQTRGEAWRRREYVCTTRPAFYGRIGGSFLMGISEEEIVEMNRGLVQKALEEARSEEANLVIWDRRDTFTIEQDDLAEIELGDDHLRSEEHTSELQ